MATKPSPGGSDGTWGAELNAHLEISLASDGKVKTEALQTDSTAPSADAAVANKKYVDDQITASHVAARCKAWVTHNSSGTIQGSGYNITSTGRNALGDYTVTWDTDFADTNYAVSINSHTVTDEGTFCSIKTKAVGSVRYTVTNRAGSNVDFACDVMAFGTQ